MFLWAFFFFFSSSPSFPLPPTSLQPSELQVFRSAAKCLFFMEKVLAQSVVGSVPRQGPSRTPTSRNVALQTLFYFNNISLKLIILLKRKGCPQEKGICSKTGQSQEQFNENPRACPHHTLPSQELVGCPSKVASGPFLSRCSPSCVKSQRVIRSHPFQQEKVNPKAEGNPHQEV